jgi:hypothetical protein
MRNLPSLPSMTGLSALIWPAFSTKEVTTSQVAGRYIPFGESEWQFFLMLITFKQDVLILANPSK